MQMSYPLRLRDLLIVLILAPPVMAPLLGATSPAAAATFGVNPRGPDCDDTRGESGEKPFCSLQASIHAANRNPGADTIELHGGDTYTLTKVDNFDGFDPGANGLPRIASEITILGHGAVIERSAAPTTPAFRIFLVEAEGTLELRDLTIRNGDTVGVQGERDGAGIRNLGTLRLIGCTLSGNVAGGDGGALCNEGEATLRDSLFQGNRATGWGATGGAVFNTERRGSVGRMRIEGCTITANESSTQAGGVWNETEMVISNSTLSGNRAEEEGGGLRNNGALTLTHVTIVENRAGREGGGVHNLGTLHLENSLLAKNEAPDGADCKGAAILRGPSLIGNLEACSLRGDASAVVSGQDPQLGPLKKGAGPSATHALRAGSPAIDGGGAQACAATDQRGMPRPQGTACDLGAYEAVERATVNAAAEPACDDRMPGAGPFCTIAPALRWIAPGGTVALAAGTYRDRLVLSEDLVLEGSGAEDTVLDGEGAGRVLKVEESATVVVRGLTLTGGNSRKESERDGAGIWNLGDLTLERCVVTRNETADDGGGILNNGKLTVKQSTISDNRGDHWGSGGGGLYNEAVRGPGIVTLVESTVSGNFAGDDGGGIWTNGQLRLINSTVSGNTATTTGGGIRNNGELILNNSTIAANQAGTLGGGLRNSSGTITISNSLIAGNSAAEGPDCYGALVSAGYNLIHDSRDCRLSAAVGDIVGRDPHLVALGKNSSPGGQTHALRAPSPAIDAGNPATAGSDIDGACEARDQRGQPRPLDGDGDGSPRCDIGSYEMVPER